MAVLNAAVAGFASSCRDRLAGVVMIDASNRWHYDGVTSINDLRGKTSETVAAARSSISSVAQGFSRYLSGHTAHSRFAFLAARRARSLCSTCPNLLMRRNRHRTRPASFRCPDTE